METIEFQTKAMEIKQAIDKSTNVLLHLHPSPDPDSAGSTLALAEYCESLGKKVTIIGGDSELSQTLSVLPGFGQILSKAYGEINSADYDLFLVLDSGATTMISKKTEVTFPEEMMVVNIDHHKSNTGYGQIVLLDPGVPATAEIVADLLLVWGATITPTMAENLYAGIHGDTGGFRYANTTAETMAVASKLLAVNPLATRAILEMGRMFPRGLLRYKALAFSAIEEVAGGKGALIALALADLDQAGINFLDTEAASLSTELLSIKDWLFGVTLVEKEAGQVRVSLRSKNADVLDVSKVAVSLGGGGHAMAAGIMLLMTVEEAKKKLVEEIEKELAGQK